MVYGRRVVPYRYRGVVRRRLPIGMLPTVYRAARAAAPYVRKLWSAYKRRRNGGGGGIPPAKRMKTMVQRRYHTMGNRGRRFKKPRRMRKSKYLQRGVVLNTEAGNVVTNAKTVHIGHSTPVHQTFFVACNYIVKVLFRRLGQKVTSMYELPQELGFTHLAGPGNMRLGYQFVEGGATSYINIVVAANDSYEACANLLFNQIVTICQSNAWVQLRTLEFVENNTDAVNSRLDLSEMVLDISISSKLAVQNRTVASTEAGDQTNMLDIANNPLNGNCYEGNGNYCRPKWVQQTGTIVEPVGNPLSGVITWDIDAANMTADMKDQWQRPLPGNAYENVNKTTRVILKPGEIKHSYLHFKRKIYINKLLDICRSNLAVTNLFSTWGKFKMFSLEKECNTGVDEPSISIGYEANNCYRICGYFSKTSTLPLQFVFGP